MRRGDIVTVAGGSPYTSKPRPAVIVQSDLFDATLSVTLCPCTTERLPASAVRVELQPNSGNGLRRTTWVMADKVTTLPRARLGPRIGSLDPSDATRLDRALHVFLGLAGA